MARNNENDVDLDRLEGAMRHVRSFSTVYAGYLSAIVVACAAACVAALALTSVAPFVLRSGNVPVVLLTGAGVAVGAVIYGWLAFHGLASVLRTTRLGSIFFALTALAFIAGAIFWLGLAIWLLYLGYTRWQDHPTSIAIGLVALGVQGLLASTLAFFLARTSWAYIAASFSRPSRRRLLAMVDRTQGYSTRNVSLFLGGGISPPTVRRGAWLINALNVARCIFAGAAPLLVMAAIAYVTQVSSGAIQGETSGIDAFVAVEGVALYLALALTVWLLSFLARACLRAARARARFGLDAMRDSDKRPPILFLRPFKDDQVKLTRKAASWFALEPKKRELDHILVEEFSWAGPVVAIGRPGPNVQPFGAARTFLSDDVWQREARNLAEAANEIIMVVDDTPGVQWEIQQTSQQALRQKTLFLLHPRFADSAVNAPIMARLCAGMGIAPPSLNKPVVAFWFDPEGAPRYLRSSTFSIDVYTMAMRDFFRGRRAAQPAYQKMWKWSGRLF